MAHNTFSYAEFLMSSHYGSYFLGLIDPRQIAPLLVDPLDAPCFKLLVPGPAFLPTSLLTDEQFQHGAIFGYAGSELDGEVDGYGPLPTRIVNWIWNFFHREMRYETDRAYVVGYILGALSSLAEYERTLALAGIAHLSFLLSLVPSLPRPHLMCALAGAGAYHDCAVRAFRERVHAIKAALGLDGWAASCAALVNECYASVPYADGSLSNGIAQIDESEVA